MVNTHIMASVRSMEPLLGTPHIIEIKGRTREKERERQLIIYTYTHSLIMLLISFLQ